MDHQHPSRPTAASRLDDIQPRWRVAHLFRAVDEKVSLGTWATCRIERYRYRIARRAAPTTTRDWRARSNALRAELSLGPPLGKPREAARAAVPKESRLVAVGLSRGRACVVSARARVCP